LGIFLSRKNHPVQTPDEQLTKALHRLAICPAGGQPQGRAALVILGLAGAGRLTKPTMLGPEIVS